MRDESVEIEKYFLQKNKGNQEVDTGSSQTER